LNYPPVRKSLGQHFLTDPSILARIVDALDVSAGETVVEVGPGRGALTDILAGRARRVIAIEYDRALAAHLRDRFATNPRVEIVEANVLETNVAAFADGPFKLIGNVPYYITTPIIFQTLRLPRPRVAVFLVQREVAERIVARAGSDAYGALSVNIQAVASATIVFHVAAGSFQPPPKVDSAVVRLVDRPEPLVSPEHEQRFREFVQAAFGMRRKQMIRVVREVRGLDASSAARALDAAGIPATARVETVEGSALARLLQETSAT
jgi:16S rRNA (adenine1518-N6/adenine1519-N6)-dimethyltransferase